MIANGLMFVSSTLHRSSHNEVLMANLMVLGSGAFGGVTSLVLCKMGLRQLPVPSTLWGHSKKLEVWTPPPAPPKMLSWDHACALILDF